MEVCDKPYVKYVQSGCFCGVSAGGMQADSAQYCAPPHSSKSSHLSKHKRGIIAPSFAWTWICYRKAISWLYILLCWPFSVMAIPRSCCDGDCYAGKPYRISML